MSDKNLENMISDLGNLTHKPARQELAGEIKSRIPHKLVPHKGKDTINIMIDLRISKLTAAAAIIMTLILCISFLGEDQPNSEGFIKESKLMVNYLFGGGKKAVVNNEYAGIEKLYNNLLSQGEDVHYYGNIIKPQDKQAVLIQWKIAEDKYRVIFADMSTKTINGEELVKLQSQMLLDK